MIYIKKMKQNGNALFLILIAVALFAALSYAVTQSGRGGGNIDREQAALNASMVVQEFSVYSTAISRLKIFGCAQNEISYEGPYNPDFTGTYINPSSSIPCQVFQNAGGGVTYSDPQDSFLDSSFTGLDGYGRYAFTRNMGINGAGILSTPDYTDYSQMVIVPYISDNICLAINEEVNDISFIPESSATITNIFAFGGGFPAGGQITCDIASITDPIADLCTTDILGCVKVGALEGSSSEANIAFHNLMQGTP